MIGQIVTPYNVLKTLGDRIGVSCVGALLAERTYIYANEVDGTFSGVALVRGSADGLACGDLDGDTGEDIVVAGWHYQPVEGSRVLWNAGGNSFTPGAFLRPSRWRSSTSIWITTWTSSIRRRRFA